MSDLIVIGYPDQTTAQRVWNELVKLEQDYLVDLEDAAIIRRDAKGKLHVTTPPHHAVAWGTLSGMFWGVLIGLLFLFPLAPLVGVAGGIMGAALGAAGISVSRKTSSGGFRNWYSRRHQRSCLSSGRSPRTGSWKRCGPTAGRCCRHRSPTTQSSSSGKPCMGKT